MISRISSETLDAPSSDGLVESISLFEGLFQRYALDLGSHRFLCKLLLWNLDLLLNSLDWDLLLLHSLELLLRHLFSVVELESTTLCLNRN